MGRGYPQYIYIYSQNDGLGKKKTSALDTIDLERDPPPPVIHIHIYIYMYIYIYLFYILILIYIYTRILYTLWNPFSTWDILHINWFRINSHQQPFLGFVPDSDGGRLSRAHCGSVEGDFFGMLRFVVDQQNQKLNGAGIFPTGWLKIPHWLISRFN